MSWKDRLKRSILGEEGPTPSEAVAAAAPSSGASTDDLMTYLRNRIVALADGKLQLDEVDPTAHLFDSGYLDSLSAVTFMLELERDYGMRIDDVEMLSQWSSLEAIVERLRTAA